MVNALKARITGRRSVMPFTRTIIREYRVRTNSEMVGGLVFNFRQGLCR